MTTIIATRDEAGVIRFGWDSQVTSGGTSHAGTPKVFANGKVIFGCSGIVRTANILRYMDVPARKKGQDTRKWIVRHLIPAIISELKRVDAAYVSDHQVNTLSSVIIAVDDVLGYLGGDLGFHEDRKDAYAVGSGAAYALGALLAGRNESDSLRIASHLDLYTNDDITVKKAKRLLKEAK